MINGLVLILTGLLLGKLYVRRRVKAKNDFLNSMIVIASLVSIFVSWISFVEVVEAIVSVNLGKGNARIGDFIIFIGTAILIYFLVYLYKEEVKRETLLYQLELSKDDK